MSIKDQEKVVRDLLRENPEAAVKDFAPYLEEVEANIRLVHLSTISRKLENKALKVLRDFPRLVEQHTNLGF